MAVSSAQVSVTTTATLLSASETDSVVGQGLSLYNAGAVTTYLGGSGVTTTTGLALPAGASIAVTLDTGESLYGIVGSGSCVVGVLRVGV